MSSLFLARQSRKCILLLGPEDGRITILRKSVIINQSTWCNVREVLSFNCWRSSVCNELWAERSFGEKSQVCYGLCVGRWYSTS